MSLDLQGRLFPRKIGGASAPQTGLLTATTRAGNWINAATGNPPDLRCALGSRAFTLLEVMIAMAIFFIAIFSILELTSRCLRAARGLQQTTVDPGGLASSLTLSNRLEEGSLPTDLVAGFEEAHPGCRCDGEIALVSTNGLYRVDFRVYAANSTAPAELTILLYRPESLTGLGGASIRPGRRSR